VATLDIFSGSGPTFVTTSTNANVLNNYRSYTYKFTLAGIPKDDINNPDVWRTSSPSYIILESGGKGTWGLIAPSDERIQIAGQAYQNQSTNVNATTQGIAVTKQNLDILNSAAGVVPGFNKSSPGKFDLFIENVDIETTYTYNQTAGTTLPVSINFDVIEPYSINGFLEALYAVAVSTGYPGYASAVFLLKLEFVGYPDNDSLPEPAIVEKSTRYFPIMFKEVNFEVTERGSIYKCKCQPFTESGFGIANIVKKSMNMQGKTVGQALEDFITKLNKVATDNAVETTGSPTCDTYAIEFPEIVNNKLDFTKKNAMYNQTIAESLRSNVVGAFPDPQTVSQKTNYQNQSGQNNTIYFNVSTNNFQIQVHENTRIHEQIAAVIRDSEYTANLLKTLNDAGTIDEYGFVKYFVISMKIENQSELDNITLKPVQKYTYVVSPYLVHYSYIPGFENQQIDYTKFKNLISREYNYLYTGKNVDVLGFKLNFNQQYYQALPAAINNTTVPAKDGAATGNTSDATFNGANISNLQQNQVNSPGARGVVISQVPDEGATGGGRSTDPYRNLARNMHSAFVNNISMTTGDLEILGDPFFISTTGIGNYNADALSRGVTVDGEADRLKGQIPIRINFRNPVDIGTDGNYIFDTDLVPFSGIFRVEKTYSSFKEGAFKQRLHISRMPGQIEPNSRANPTPVTGVYKQFPDPQDVTQQDTTDAVQPNALNGTSVPLSSTQRLSLSGLSNLLQTSGVGIAATIAAAAAILKSKTGLATAAGIGALTAVVKSSNPTTALTANAQASVSALGANASQLVGNVGNSLNAIIQTPNSIAASLQKQATALTASVPGNVDLASAGKNIALDLLPPGAVANLPPTAPLAVAPSPAVDTKFLTSLAASGGTGALAKAFGVKNVNQISPALLSPDVEKTVLSAVPASIKNPLSALNAIKNPVDATAITGALNSVQTQVASVTGNVITQGSSAVSSVQQQFGSTSLNNSPLNKIMIG
jgi:hypothetical protein